MSLIIKAAALANRAHEGQKRKYSGLPYVHHPARVAARVALLGNVTEVMVAAAFVHDVVEDTVVKLPEIEELLGSDVADLVSWLTNPSKGMNLNRSERKAIDRAHLSKAPREAKVIKLADRIDNLREMTDAPEDFRKLYGAETLLLLDAIGASDNLLSYELRELAENLIHPRSP